MSDKIKDGGPAFPVSTSNRDIGHQDGPNTWQFPGMTLRDYFAAHAPIDVADANEAFYRAHGRNARTSEMLDTLAGLRSMYADAMLKAREAE